MNLTTTMPLRQAEPPRARWSATLASSRSAQFLLLLAVALLVRGATFGEWNYDVDEQFYALVGRRMLEGATLYVDIWDRKPPALYLLYAGIAAISKSVLAFQLASTLSAALGAFGIARLAHRFVAAPAALMAGIAYLVLLGRFGGASGQAPVWYTTLMIFAAWTIVSRLDLLRQGRLDARIVAGMAAAGLAIAFKQSAAIECGFFGLFIAAHLVRSSAGWPRSAAQLALLAGVALLPMAATVAWYWQAGHLPALGQALVTSNVTRLYETPWGRVWRFGALIGLLGMPIVFAALGWATLRREERRDARPVFLAMWAIVALLAVAVFPNIFYHYAIPILAPLCVLCALFFERRAIGRIGFAALLVVGLFYGNTLNLTTRLAAHRAAPALVAHVRAETPHRRLLVWGAPSYLYVLTDARPPAPLAFPAHLFDGAERGSSGIDETAEMRRILAGQPETVVAQDPLPANPLNTQNIALLDGYTRTCARQKRFTIYDHDGAQEQIVYSRCGHDQT